MNPSFNIQPAAIDSASSNLYMEIGPTGFSFVIADKVNCFSAVVIYSFPSGMPAANVAEIIAEIFTTEPLLRLNYKKTSISWSFSESVLVPDVYMQSDLKKELLELVYGNAVIGNVKSDFMYKHTIHNIYRVPETVIAKMPMVYHYCNQTHQYSILPDIADKERNCLFVILYTQQLTILLSKKGKLQVVQTFNYQNAEDAAFHLLNVCECYGLAPEDITLQLQGLIDVDSNLYTVFYKYFLNIEMGVLPVQATYSDTIQTYPPHFFSHLFAQAICV